MCLLNENVSIDWKYAYWMKMCLLNESFFNEKSRTTNFFITFCYNCDVAECDWWRKNNGSYESDGYKIWQKWHTVDQDWELKKWYEIEIPLKTSARKTPHCLIAGSNFIFHQPGDADCDLYSYKFRKESDVDVRDVWFVDNICKQQWGRNLLLGTQVSYGPARYCQWGFKKIRKMIFLLFVYSINNHSSPISSSFGIELRRQMGIWRTYAQEFLNLNNIRNKKSRRL